jgi:hypothetical protein
MIVSGVGHGCIVTVVLVQVSAVDVKDVERLVGSVLKSSPVRFFT